MTAALSDLEEYALDAAREDAESVWNAREDVEEYLNVLSRSYVVQCVCCGILEAKELPDIELLPHRRIAIMH